MEYRSAPEEHGLTEAQADIIHDCYVNQRMSMKDARLRVQRLLGGVVSSSKISRFVNANGWKRSQSYYAKRGLWARQNQASYQEAKATRGL